MIASNLTEETVAAIEEGLRNGAPLAVAAQAAGLSKATILRWLERGRKGRDVPKPYRELVRRVETARAQGQLAILAGIARAAADDWRAAAWLLERSDPDRWARASARARTKPPEEDETPPPADDPFAEVDELAARRSQRT